MYVYLDMFATVYASGRGGGTGLIVSVGVVLRINLFAVVSHSTLVRVGISYFNPMFHPTLLGWNMR